MSLVRLARIFDFREWDSVSIAFPTGDEQIKGVSREGSLARKIRPLFGLMRRVLTFISTFKITYNGNGR
jgi:hypothetical protein